MNLKVAASEELSSREQLELKLELELKPRRRLKLLASVLSQMIDERFGFSVSCFLFRGEPEVGELEKQLFRQLGR